MTRPRLTLGASDDDAIQGQNGRWGRAWKIADATGRLLLQFLATFTLGVGGASSIIFGLAGAPPFVHIPRELQDESYKCAAFTPSNFYGFLLGAVLIGAVLNVAYTAVALEPTGRSAVALATLGIWFTEALMRRAFLFLALWMAFVVPTIALSMDDATLPFAVPGRSRLLYKWFSYVFRLSMICGLFGSVVFCVSILHFFIHIDELIGALDKLADRFEREFVRIFKVWPLKWTATDADLLSSC
jgi:hypothetical protein